MLSSSRVHYLHAAEAIDVIVWLTAFVTYLMSTKAALRHSHRHSHETAAINKSSLGYCLLGSLLLLASRLDISNEPSRQ